MPGEIDVQGRDPRHQRDGRTRFMPEESSPDDGRYFFAYAVEIINTGPERVQLRARYWKIIDGNGQIQEVRGAGVVGKQPVLGPGQKASTTPAGAR